MEDTTAAIRVDGLTRTCGDVTAVDDLSFAVEASELFGLLGPNGAGRSTLIDVLVGLTDVRDDPVGTYSGGMKRRLEIGRGLLHDAAVLLLDEPTAG